jgi:hypothetical protein
MARLGYRVAFFADSDRPISPDCSSLKLAGIEVIRWEGEVSTEQRIAHDIPWTALQEIVNLAIEEHEPASVLGAVKDKLGERNRSIEPEVASWLSDGIDQERIRQAIGEAAMANEKTKRRGWFKRRDRGEALGLIIAKSLDQIQNTDLAKKLGQLETWCYG